MELRKLKLDEIFRGVGRRGYLNFLSDKAYISICYYLKFGARINLNSPKTFNEKLQWLKLYDRRSEYPLFVDKVKVKQYVTEKIGKQYIIPTLGTWEHSKDISIDALPDSFVLKCNHDSSSVIICKDKASFDSNVAFARLEKALKRSGYLYGREWPYKMVNPLIMAEPYLEDTKLKELRDYKFFCFDGVVKFFKVDVGRFSEHHANYFDINLNLLPFGELSYPFDPDIKIEFPKEIFKMAELAEKLSSGYPFLRVDLYNVDGRIYFSELTLYPASGFGTIYPEEWDKKIGDYISL